MTTEPPIITGSSTTALNFWPAFETSTSIPSVRRTFKAVPAGTVTALRAAAGLGVGGGGAGLGFRAVNSTAVASSSGISERSRCRGARERIYCPRP